MKETVAVGDRVDSVPCGRTAPVHPVVFVTVAQPRDRCPCHARPDSRMTSHRTYKAGYRDAHYLWSGYFLSLTCGSHRPRWSHRLLPQHRRRHRCPGQLLPCPCGGTGSHGSHGRLRTAALRPALGTGPSRHYPQSPRRAPLRRRHGFAGEDRLAGRGCDRLVRRGQALPAAVAILGQPAATPRPGTRLCQLTAIRTAQRNQSRLVTASAVLASFTELLALVARQIRELEIAIAALISEDPLWHQLDQVFRSIKGVADRTVARLMAEMPEIGTLSNKAISKLAGVAPLARDSGKQQGKRAVRGGRPQVREILFVVAGVAGRYEPDFIAFQQRLRAAGKPGKVIRIALAHKLLVRLNAKAGEVRQHMASEDAARRRPIAVTN